MLYQVSTPWRCGNGEPPPGGKQPSPPGKLPRAFLDRPVLVIEDEAMIAWTLESVLEDMGFASITLAARDEEALAAAARLQPGLILSDINLGPRGMDGIAIVAEIRKTIQAVPVIFISGYAGPESIARIAADVPGAALLRKPAARNELQRAVTELANGPKSH